jgi:hypothetical protein
MWKQGLERSPILPKIDYGDIFANLVFLRSDADIEKTKSLKAESNQAVRENNG